MSSENHREDIRKAMAYDLLQIFESEPDKTYTAEELKKLLAAYIKSND